jgi:hypothetical protein
MLIPDSGTDFFPSRIPDPNCFHPGSASKNLSILTPKNGFKALGNMILVVHPESRIRILTFYPSRILDPGVKKAPDPDPQHWIEGSGSRPLTNESRSRRLKTYGSYGSGSPTPVLRIRDVYPGSRILICTHPGSRISDPGSKNSSEQG